MPISNPEIWDLLIKKIPSDTRVTLPEIYRIVEGNLRLDNADIAPVTPINNSPTWQRNVRRVLQYRKSGGDLVWLGRATYLFPTGSDKAPYELAHRRWLWRQISAGGVVVGVEASKLNQLGIFAGQAGIWRDAARTKLISGDEVGITVSLLHRGDRYPDELTGEGLTYHFPDTGRPGETDKNEV